MVIKDIWMKIGPAVIISMYDNFKTDNYGLSWKGYARGCLEWSFKSVDVSDVFLYEKQIEINMMGYNIGTFCLHIDMMLIDWKPKKRTKEDNCPIPCKVRVI
ncbi:alpha2 protein [Porcine ephemerovirus 1]|uniref:Alpha2 protein n=1 Tax=Porcine ephemerovirus 1 TaxID=2928256 RepID=A0AAX3A7S1_9RHAB|nr:alpha2 protein [Porcine ephemerovirus 1]UNP42113.1 alpha2 protein [Porcine ephemerovirus 1]